MEINVEDNFMLLFDKNNNTAYKALQALQKNVRNRIGYIVIWIN